LLGNHGSGREERNPIITDEDGSFATAGATAVPAPSSRRSG